MKNDGRVQRKFAINFRHFKQLTDKNKIFNKNGKQSVFFSKLFRANVTTKSARHVINETYNQCETLALKKS